MTDELIVLDLEDGEVSIEKLLELSDEQLDFILATALAAVCEESDSPESFFAFYHAITGIPCPEHCQAWIEDVYENKAIDRGMLIWAFRGSWKTTTLTILFTAYRIGKEPEKSNLILQNNDDSAKKATAAVAKIIRDHPNWKRCFPDVVPDKRRGWGAEGYWVKRESMTDEEWAALTPIEKDPTLLGLGIGSGSVIGKHPDGVMFIDDIHDEDNTVSERERARIVQILTETVMPLSVSDAEKEPGHRQITWEIAVGTPWNEDDAYHYLRETGEYGFSFTPVMTKSLPEEDGAILFDHRDLQGWYHLSWPERFPQDIVVSWYNKTGRRGFGRMYMLDLHAGIETALTFHSYPHEEIDLRWPTSSGVDYASTMEIRGRVIEEKSRSKFALCTGMKLPTGGAVIYDGFVGHVSQLKAENKTAQNARAFPNFITTAVEMNGKGEEFFHLMSRHQDLAFWPYWTGKMSKQDRHERITSPYLENGMVKISDADTPYLNALRKSLREFPHGNMDVLDALFGFLKTVPDVLMIPDNEGTLPSMQRRKKEKKRNPFLALGKR